VRGRPPALHVGAVSTYHELESDRPMTDDEWRERVQSRRAPPMPSWTTSYVASVDVDALVARIAAGEIPEEIRSVRDDRVGRAPLAAIRRLSVGVGRQESALGRALAYVQPYVDGPLRDEVLDAAAHVLLGAGASHRWRRLELTEDFAASMLESSLRVRERD